MVLVVKFGLHKSATPPQPPTASMIDLQPEWAKSAASCVAGVEQDMAALYARYCHAEDAIEFLERVLQENPSYLAHEEHLSVVKEALSGWKYKRVRLELRISKLSKKIKRSRKKDGGE
ncbi:hypothetical protein GRF29_8g201642 [Pseudopithomyces chartarum]|uniref:Uncharacterized protein n=1 Tax=Pseudopithomyces chartarum TaxID=1892770 RepID=A0AAN6RM52_9PLEO|nr:hypothetical protein GRF29_8g201642 [Pseudopithomyces chartarum]